MKELLRSKKIAIVGGGSIGTVLAYALNISGIKPMIIHRSWDRLSIIKRRGLKLILRNGEEVTVVAEHTHYSLLPKPVIDVAFIAVKAYDVKDAALRLKGLLKKDSIVITCQNGLWSAETVSRVVEGSSVAIAVLNVGAYRDGEVVRLTGVGESYLGYLRGSNQQLLEEIAQALSPINVRLAQNINGYRWVKLGVNAGINPVTALLGIRNGELLKDEHALEIATLAAAEVKEIAKATGIKLPKDPISELLRVASLTSDNYSSMFQDILNGRRTEVDYINGAVYIEGLKYGVKALVNYTLWKLVKGLESVNRYNHVRYEFTVR